jgi:FAD/FMN-containing dehydrogenase
VSHTGVAGLTLGGGQGWLSSKYGLTVDSLREVTLVTAEGRTVTASSTSEPELFWALRGGGGGFGAVTEFTFDLHPVGPMILGGMLLFPAERAVEICAFYSDFVAGAPADFGGGAVILSAPPAPFVPPEAVGAPLLSVLISWFGDHEVGERYIAPLRDLRPMVDLVGPIPYVALQQMIDEGNPFGRRQYWTAHYMDRLSPQLLGDVADLAINRPSVFSDLILAPMGVAAREADPDATAFGHREASWLFHPIAQWDAAEDDAANIAWAKAIKAAAAPYAIAGTYLNVDGTGTAERSRFAFGEATFARLAAIKAQWDPDNVFRHAIPVSGDQRSG